MQSRMTPPLPEPSPRKPIGVLLIVAGIAVYSGVVAALSNPIGRLPALAQAPIYLVLGIAWIAPLRPLLRWMEAGR